MLFLGAGASVPMGIGDIEVFTRDIINQTDGDLRNNIDITQQLLNNSQEFLNFRFNLEVLYSILHGMSNRWHSLNELGPFPVLMNNLLNNNNEFNSLQISQREFSNFELIVKNVIVTSINTYNDDHERRQRAKNLVGNIGEGLKNLSK